MDIFEAINGRRSIRKYSKDGKIPKEDLMKIVQAGLNAPSARSIHPVKCVVITEKSGLDRLALTVGNNGKFVSDAAAAFIVISDDTKYYLEDGCAAVENMLLALHALGYGGCWIAGDKKDYCNEVLELVRAPKSQKLIAIISAGIPEEKPIKEKPKAEERCVFESF